MKHTNEDPIDTVHSEAHIEVDDDELWEDISNYKSLMRQNTPPRSESRSPPSTLRKRKTGRAIYIAALPRKQFIVPVTSPPKPSTSQVIASGLANDLSAGVLFTIKYVKDVIHRAILLLRWPLSVLLFLWILAWIIGRISYTLRKEFAPLCLIPGMSRFAMCSYKFLDNNQTPKWADYPKLVDVQSATFEQLLDHSIGGSGLSLEIKKAEMATADLVTLVRISDLTSRDMLAKELLEFVSDAKKTGRGLQKLDSKVRGAVDKIMAVNDFALHSIESAISKTPPPYSLKVLLPWYTPPPTDEIILRTFTDAMYVLSTSMERLILEAEASVADLDRLEEHLSALHDLVSREDSSISSAKSELLSDLWTILGGNRQELRGFDKHLVLLKNLGSYRQQALVHVVTALQTLQAMSEDMEDLRERVAAPDTSAGRIPVEVHLKSIRSGLERLREGRLHAKAKEDEAVRRVLSITPD